jgi:DNA-binding MurR/RpiR family transcriptional regulator
MSYRLSNSYNPKGTGIELLNNTFNKDIENMVNTLNRLSHEDLRKTIDLLVKSKNIYVVGYNDSFILASYMALRLGQIRDGIVLLNQLGGMYPFEISSASNEDVLIAYLFPRYSTYTINIINILRERGLKVIIITSNNIMPVKDLGDIIIPTFVTGLNVKDSIVAPIFLSNFIANSVAYEDYDNSMKNLKNAEEILSKGYYLTSK